MDLTFPPKQERFRQDVRALLARESVREEVARVRALPADQEPGLLDTYRLLGERGWLAPNWPQEYGGIGATIVEKAIVTEELIAAGVPDVAHTLSIDIVGLAVYLHGTPEQKARWLPSLAAGESIGCVLFSEPETGSDLGSLATRAEPDPEGWRLRGRKLYSLKAHMGDFALCLARTGSSEVRYSGLSVFIVPLDNTGVLISPLWTMMDEHFGAVTLDGPLVTRADVLGEIGDGWRIAGEVLRLERTGIELEAKARRTVDALLANVAEDTAYADRLVALDAEVEAGRLLSWRAVGTIADDVRDEALYAMAKWHTSETAKSAAVLAAELAGMDAALSLRDESAVPGSLVEHGYRDGPGFTIASGTSEVMLSMIASTALGLPS
ncbi:acyl-CoA dehydrogenase family protein [Actinocrispum wychmicini]|uniref:Alkylation response protein AidB-like acyl-CoA dehydrogenase n=1 Tax=Actinocrispum wychmicini TaxID=1213861 RepID=A0A4R2JU77_9PSEU|nr:acyl-CoA dehydrogenase family protein [Actinocrispum wychmicini]TCO60858.1 alkylation response protein AidB-like acyl-CoA dehydrogenase [Actinocrispum wychmicini]